MSCLESFIVTGLMMGYFLYILGSILEMYDVYA